MKPSENSGHGAAIFAGAGIGLLVGLIMGLSVSPVVSVILGALASLLAVFLGVQDGLATRTGKDPEEQSRIGMRLTTSSLKAASFGFSCILGILAGLYMRSNDFFSPSPTETIALYTEAGFEQDEAKKLLVFQRFGILPGGGEAKSEDMQKAHSSSLFAKASDPDTCLKIKPERYKGDPVEIAYGYENLHRTEFDNLAGLLRSQRLDDQEKLKLAQTVWELLCADTP